MELALIIFSKFLKEIHEKLTSEVASMQTGHGCVGNRNRRTFDVHIAIWRMLVHVDVNNATIFGTFVNHVFTYFFNPIRFDSFSF